MKNRLFSSSLVFVVAGVFLLAAPLAHGVERALAAPRLEKVREG